VIWTAKNKGFQELLDQVRKQQSTKVKNGEEAKAIVPPKET
jgi:hypothetical protein